MLPVAEQVVQWREAAITWQAHGPGAQFPSKNSGSSLLGPSISIRAMQHQPGCNAGDVEISQLTQHDLEEKPWKYVGYKALARYVSSADDFFVLRRFDRLHSRILLRLQDQLAKLEDDLDLIDAEFSQKEAQDVDNGCFRNDQTKRKDLLDLITAKMERYDQLVVNYLTLKAREPAPKMNTNNIKQWLENHRQPIHPDEIGFLHADDLITASRISKSALRRSFEQHVLAPTTGLFGLFALKPSPDALPGEAETTVLGKDEHVDAVAALAIFFAAAVMLIAPLWTLVVVDGMFKKLGIITVFLFLFLGILTWGTLSRPFEILAATAG